MASHRPATTGDVFGCRDGELGGCYGIEWVETGDAAHHPTMHGTASGPGTARGQFWAAGGLSGGSPWLITAHFHVPGLKNVGKKLAWGKEGGKRLLHHMHLQSSPLTFQAFSEQALPFLGTPAEYGALPADGREHREQPRPAPRSLGFGIWSCWLIMCHVASDSAFQLQGHPLHLSPHRVLGNRQRVLSRSPPTDDTPAPPRVTVRGPRVCTGPSTATGA